MRVGEIYTTFMGECNKFGIGHPSIFLRLSGCPIRCYAMSLKTLCDTPLHLIKSGENLPIDESDRFEGLSQNRGSIIEKCNVIRQSTGISLVCLTGGDPLWNKEAELIKLFSALQENKFSVVVETSGVIDVSPYLGFANTTFVIDYKLKSAAVPKGKHYAFMRKLREGDYIKFVVYDMDDFYEMVSVVNTDFFRETKAQLSAGIYWGGKLQTFELFEFLKDKGLLGKVSINMQTHKMAVASDYKKFIPEKI